MFGKDINHSDSRYIYIFTHTKYTSISIFISMCYIKAIVDLNLNHFDSQTSKSKSRQIIWEQMADMPEVNKIDEVLRYVRQGKFAFLTDYSYVEYLMLQDCLTFAMADDKFNNAGLGYVLPKNSKFLQAFDYA